LVYVGVVLYDVILKEIIQLNEKTIIK